MLTDRIEQEKGLFGFTRGVTLALAVVSFLPGIAEGQAQSPPRAGPPTFAPEVRICSDDYARARAAFHTTLVKTGPAPGAWHNVALPIGVSVIEFTSGDLRLTAWLQVPDGKTNASHPTVLWLHGGHSFDLGDWAATKPYRDAGYVVMVPLLRAENGHDGAYSLFYDEVDDVIAAADYLRRQRFADPHHFYVAGSSVGGTMTMLAAMTYKKFTAAASISGSPDQMLFIKYAMANRQGDIPFDAKNAEEVEMRSPLSFAASLRCPIRLYYGSDEPHFRLTSERLAQVASAHNLDAQAIQVEGNHTTVVPSAIERSIEFFRALDANSGTGRGTSR
jgi:poly(3-hydroxybutyrate) depolymerase